MIRSRRFNRWCSALLLATFSLTSCTTTEAPTGPVAAAQSAELQVPIVTPLLNGLLSCNPQPGATATRVIGPAGGTLWIGRHLLVVPPGALAAPVTITGQAPTDRYASVTFTPHGLNFQRSAVLTLDYSHCPAGRLNIFKRIAYTNDRLDIISFLLSIDNLLTMRVTGRLDHFSRYAVAW